MRNHREMRVLFGLWCAVCGLLLVGTFASWARVFGHSGPAMNQLERWSAAAVLLLVLALGLYGRARRHLSRRVGGVSGTVADVERG
jgi:hypothetical protein